MQNPDQALFEANKVYQLPSGEDFSTVVSPPDFGKGRITVHGATVSLEVLADIVTTGLFETPAGKAADKRHTASTASGKTVTATEYVETGAVLTTRPGK